ncbi:LysR family transcriptional regulator [Agrobacterium rubi]|uniref:HTH-type transcriptional regulator TtuA n=1 Tax=Agrobacterium rubi TaxID=28099 RepID=A0AAE7UPK8_9HYPH|nr:LysR family transcriptional regulator [Agrobacterium rubi]NTE86605.1 LysR family transcriptional regulator [Agrobacterium rubi]NTF02537.1 LysR family transcriptional regulator [Agrobacterium rubi]NTF36782.1 LysR family transcriptional regulator [Agrobacterium rubi]OCJ55597.1 LysR family transcriptional regulator [Agrobacterium rubi]QTF99230.1 LysR family transcriptional regulator [Agrobacterium rubi]
MPQENFNDLVAFVMVAREESFTKAAVKLGVSQSALSQTVRGLEERLGIRLLTRTTRRVSPTAAGERLLQTAGPRFEEIQAELTALTEMRDKPAGTVRITAGEHAAISVLAPALDKFLPDNPDVKVEITVDYGLTDIVAERYDAGVRLGEQVAKDMIAIRIGPEMRMAVVGSPSYFRQNPWPEKPEDLTRHNCIQIRMPTHGNILSWEFEKDGHELRVKAEGQLVFNNIAMRLDAVKRGLGLAYMPEDQVANQVADGELIRVLEDWCAPFPGYHLYYPNRRHTSPAFALVIDALRYRG